MPSLTADALLLYLVTDEAACRGRSLLEAIEAAIDGGVTVVQYRGKRCSPSEAVAAGSRIRDLCRARGIPFVVNDSVALAVALVADGVHLGQDDAPPAEARRALGPGAAIGVSVGSSEEAARATAEGADYLAASPVFATPTKPDAGPALGLAGLAAVVGATALPVVAIGGIGPANVEAVMSRGAAGIAVVSAILSADDPGAAAAELRHLSLARRRGSRGRGEP